MASSTEMKMGTKYAVFGTGVLGLGSFVVRLISWVVVISSNKKIVEEAKTLTGGLLLCGVVLLIISYLLMYNAYAKKGAREPMKLRAIALGGSWVIPFFILLVTEGLLLGGTFAGMAMMYSRFTSKAMTCAAIGMVVDIILFFVGKMFFKPDMIQKA